jgi:hypothetical protein
MSEFLYFEIDLGQIDDIRLASCFHKSVGGGFLFFIFSDDKNKKPLKDRANGKGAKRRMSV